MRWRRKHKLIEGGLIYRFIHDYLVHHRWLLEQVSQRLRLMNPDGPSARVSPELIYAAHDTGGQRHDP